MKVYSKNVSQNVLFSKLQTLIKPLINNVKKESLAKMRSREKKQKKLQQCVLYFGGVKASVLSAIEERSR